MAYLDGVLAGLEYQTVSNFDVILVDNGSNDGSCAFVAARYPWVHLIELPENFGFCKAVNEGIRASRSPYVLLLNNDIEVTENFIEEMLSAIKRHPKAFSCAARMIQFHDRDRLDDAGNYYCALGWAYARGKGKDIHTYEKDVRGGIWDWNSGSIFRLIIRTLLYLSCCVCSSSRKKDATFCFAVFSLSSSSLASLYCS